MKNKTIKLLGLILLVIFSINCALAQFTTSVTVESGSNQIMPWEEITFILEVTNMGAESDELQYYFPNDPDWSIITDPIFTKRTILPGETLTTKVIALPISERLDTKRYDLAYKVESVDSSRSKSGVFEIFVRDPDSFLDYVPIINIDIDAPLELDPRNEATISVSLDNKNRLNISSFVLDVKTKLNPENDMTIEVPLPPLSKAREKFTISYSPTLAPTEDVISITPRIPERNTTFEVITKTVEIVSYYEVEEKKEQQNSFLKTQIDVTFFNDGNVPVDYSYEVPSSIFKQFFMSSNPKITDVKKDSGYRYLKWDFNIPPQETKKISYSFNYRPLFFVVLLLIVGVVVYYLERSPLVIRKESRKMTGQKGETSRIKVLIHVKNRTNRQVDNVTVIDTVPRIAELEKEFAIGTMQPSKVIKHEKKGTIVKWKIPILEPHEERIISYQIYSKLKIIGTMNLAPSLVKFTNKRGRISRNYSNSVKSE